MGKRYYCDFCDRSFADSANNRKNHFKGVNHQRLRKLHYDSFKDAAAILADDSLKIPCKRFHNGMCDYGDDCRFSHMTPERRQQLEQQVERDRQAKEAKEKILEEEPSLDEWLAKRAKRLKTDKTKEQPVEAVQYQLPPFLMNIPNLPPSLLPPTLEDFRNAPPCEWG